MKKRSLLGLAAVFLAACGSAPSQASSANVPHATLPPSPPDGETAAKIKWAVTGTWRDGADRNRDVYRHPEETLTFFGLKDDMHVVEISPGNGWYTAILAPILASRGQLSITSGFEAMSRHPEVFGKVVVTNRTSDELVLGPDGSADLVLTFRNLHNWVPGKEDAVLAKVFKALKPGGIFGLVDHRAKADAAPPGKDGYLREDWVIAKVESAGFKLLAKSEINANPKDTTEHPKGVWTLPPSYALGAQDHAVYEAIGESDRMTLKFQKP